LKIEILSSTETNSKEKNTMSFVFSFKTHRHLGGTLFLAGLLLSVATGGVFATETGARVVKYSREDVVPVHAKLRFSTLIVLPDDEEILDFTTGDREFLDHQRIP